MTVLDGTTLDQGGRPSEKGDPTLTHCGMKAQSRLRFLDSGVEIIPLSVSYTSDGQNYRIARVKVTREAGVHIHENSTMPEPVELWTAGYRLTRLYIPKDSIRLTKDAATIRMMDPRHVLDADDLQYRNEDTTLGEIITEFRDWVMVSKQEAVNPNGIITAVKTPDALDLAQQSQSWDSKLDEYVGPMRDDAPDLGRSGQRLRISDTKFARNFRHSALNTVENMTGWLGENGGVDFEGLTVAGALHQIESVFQVSSWVDDNGVLWIGPQESQPELYVAGSGQHTWKLLEYNVTEDAHKTKAVVVKGDYEVRNDTTEGTYMDAPTQSMRIRKFGYATMKPPANVDVYDTPIGTVTAQEYQSIYGEYPSEYVPQATYDFPKWRAHENATTEIRTMNTTDGEALERAARRRLLRTIYDEKAGSVTINPLASDFKAGQPQSLRVGDYLGVIPNGHDDCMTGSLSPSAFVVNRITHELSPRKGWTMKVGVGAISTVPIISQVHTWEMDEEFNFGTDSEEYYRDVQLDTEGKEWSPRLSDATIEWFSETIADLKKYTIFRD